MTCTSARVISVRAGARYLQRMLRNIFFHDFSRQRHHPHTRTLLVELVRSGGGIGV